MHDAATTVARHDASPVAGRDHDDVLTQRIDELEAQLAGGDLRTAGQTASLLHREILRMASRIDVVEGNAVPLTCRERETLWLLGDGAVSQKDVARLLGVSRNTVKSHIKSIYLKLGAHSRSEAIEAARRLGVFGSPSTPDDERPRQRGHLTLVNQGATTIDAV